jgi:hypothetical protein
LLIGFLHSSSSSTTRVSSSSSIYSSSSSSASEGSEYVSLLFNFWFAVFPPRLIFLIICLFVQDKSIAAFTFSHETGSVPLIVARNPARRIIRLTNFNFAVQLSRFFFFNSSFPLYVLAFSLRKLSPITSPGPLFCEPSARLLVLTVIREWIFNSNMIFHFPNKSINK